jgi:hypothetical protein
MFLPIITVKIGLLTPLILMNFGFWHSMFNDHQVSSDAVPNKSLWKKQGISDTISDPRVIPPIYISIHWYTGVA